MTPSPTAPGVGLESATPGTGYMRAYVEDLERVLSLGEAFAHQLKTRTLEPVNVKKLPAMNGGQTSDFEIAAAAFFKRYADALRTVNLAEREQHSQQASAWVQVCNVLDELNPEGWEGLGTGGDCAERAIRGLLVRSQSAAVVVGGGELLRRAYEVVHHDPDCPAIGGNGDADCKCDAVPFLRELESAPRPQPGSEGFVQTVWLLWKVYEYEGNVLLGAFASESAAESMAARCRAHAATEPKFPECTEGWEMDDPRWETDPLIIAWDKDTEAWRKTAPIDGIGSGDEFAITSEQVIAAAPTRVDVASGMGKGDGE